MLTQAHLPLPVCPTSTLESSHLDDWADKNKVSWRELNWVGRSRAAGQSGGAGRTL